MRPHRRQPTRLPCPWDSLGKNTGVGCHFLLQCMKVKSESEVVQSCPTLVTPRTAAHQAPPSMGLSRQEHWSGLPFPSSKGTIERKKVKSLSCVRLFESNPMDCCPPGSSVHGTLQARILEWVAISFSQRSLVDCSPWGHKESNRLSD